MNKPTLTKKEQSIINAMSKDVRELFNKNFFKVSPRMWVCDLKHYDETYSIDDCIAIIECQN